MIIGFIDPCYNQIWLQLSKSNLSKLSSDRLVLVEPNINFPRLKSLSDLVFEDSGVLVFKKTLATFLNSPLLNESNESILEARYSSTSERLLTSELKSSRLGLVDTAWSWFLVISSDVLTNFYSTNIQMSISSSQV